MNEVVQPPSLETGAPAQLAGRQDFPLGEVMVRPSLRTIEGPSGTARGEPRVVQVLVALADARGAVLAREDLLRLCWEGRIVGDDAINRAIAEVRRIAAAVGANFEVETVSRVGYRIVGLDWGNQAGAPVASGAANRVIDRRKVLTGGIVSVLALTGGSAAVVYRRRRSEVDNLIEQGRVYLASGRVNDEQRAEALFRQAVARDPDRADAWGWLATLLADNEAEREAALRALDLDPRNANARTVLAYHRRDLEDWTRWEDALLDIIADAPDCALALSHLTVFWQGMGRCDESWNANERAVELEPFNPSPLSKRAIKHWLYGRIGEADKVADQALRLAPRNSLAWNARMLTYAFTDRAPAALSLLNDVPSRPINLTPPSVASWRAALEAIETQSRSDIANAIATCTAAASLAPGLAANAIMTFSYLGELDAAYQIAEGLFEGRGKVVQRTRGGGIRDVYSGPAWGRTQFLFIPATAPFREDLRFPELCRRIGHLAYWRKRGVWPDPFVRGALDPAKLA